MNWDGTMRDQYGRACSNYATGTNTCVNARLDITTGRYVDITTGMPVNCNSTGFDGYNTMPYYGQYGGTQINGCQGWSQVYGAQYIPVDFGNGQLVCMNTAYLGQQNPGYNFNQYYYTQQPLYTCQGYDCSGYGGYYNGYQYSGCQSQFNFGYASSGFGVGLGICL
jgi:hypothetical protein